MEGADWEFIYDGVVGFLTSPMWQIPIMSFIEKNCVVFDPSEENCHSWIDSHKEYKSLVESLLSSYLKDVGITEEQFVKACSAPSVQDRPQMQVVFEQIWAAEDFEIYKRMMVQRNIELELQALQLIQQRRAIKEPEKATSPEREDMKIVTDEDAILREVLRRSKVEYEALQKEMHVAGDKSDKEIEKALVASNEGDIKILSEKAEEKKEEMKKVVEDRIKTEDKAPPTTNPVITTTAPAESKAKAPEEKAAVKKSSPPSQEKPKPKKAQELPPLKAVSGAEAAASWLSSAKAEIANNSVGSSTSSAAKPSTDDVSAREKYLQKQRDNLLALKNKEREKRLDSYVQTQPKRPTSARVARQAVSGNKMPQEATAAAPEPDNLRMRRALAERLKKEVLYK